MNLSWCLVALKFSLALIDWKQKQTNKKKKVESDEQTELVKQLHPPSVQTVHLAWGTGIFVPSTKTPSSQLFSTLQSHCRLQRGWLKRKGKGLSGTLLLYKAFLPTDYLIWMLTDYNYQKKNIAIYQQERQIHGLAGATPQIQLIAFTANN